MLDVDDYEDTMAYPHRPNRALPPGKQWIGHCGRKAARRYLRQRYNRIAKMARRDPETERVLLLLHDAVDNEPDSDYAAMHLASAALEAAEGVKCSWAEAALALLGKFAQRETPVPDGAVV